MLGVLSALGVVFALEVTGDIRTDVAASCSRSKIQIFMEAAILLFIPIIF